MQTKIPIPKKSNTIIQGNQTPRLPYYAKLHTGYDLSFFSKIEIIKSEY